MNFTEKYQSLIVLTSVFIGVTLGQISFFQLYAEHLIIPFLMIMLTGVFIQIPLSDIKNSFTKIHFTVASLCINFIWTPLFAWALGYVFLRETPPLWIGFMMLMVTPCTDWYLVFTGISKGNVALGTSILPLNFILQLTLLPLYLLILGGSVITIDPISLLYGVFLVLIIPIISSNLLRRLALRFKNDAWLKEKILSKIGLNQMIFLNLAIIAMFASQSTILLDHPKIMLILLVPVLIFFAANFVIGQLVSRYLKFKYEDAAAFNLTTLARNSPIALAIAVASFPDQPMIALALIIGPLIELPVLTAVSQVLLRMRGRYIRAYS
ncbi:arsenic resistance protein [Geosporobacter ferrireducens]|uniref:arsenic resistance protein n=1 Tax=Geosporobacter ferrireducens TaxID=1424294 RepID=UPI00139E6543|nr:arsenic resistance protein [Geosporobacter ferrireducens]MTI54779.1 arsenic resistance protein [Geosporobacter ferrireducens]